MDRKTAILIVDDYRAMVRIVRNLLHELGFEDIDDAPDGTSALKMLKQRSYALVISDWNMQPMGGLDLLREIRTRPELTDLPFIMITAENRTENVIAAKEAGVSNYIVKPFNAETLRTKVQSVLRA